MIGSAPMFWPGMLAALIVLIVFAWLLTRHVGLALVAALSPLPGFVVAGSATRHALSVLGYLPGFIAVGILTGDIAPLAASMAARQAVGKSLKDLWPVFLVAVLM